MSTTRRYRCWLRAMARPRPAGCGSTHATSGPLPAHGRRRHYDTFYSPDRKGEHPKDHLKDFRGIIHADGYSGFNQLFAGNRIIEAACWAHVRRKFFDVHAATASPIAKALKRIGDLYAGSRKSCRDHRLAARPPATRTSAAVQADRGGAGRLGRSGTATAVPQIRTRQGLPLHAVALEGAVAMLRRRPPRPR